MTHGEKWLKMRKRVKCSASQGLKHPKKIKYNRNRSNDKETIIVYIYKTMSK